jgi:hypothetical protein
MTIVERGPVMLITYKQLTANTNGPLLAYLVGLLVNHPKSQCTWPTFKLDWT